MGAMNSNNKLCTKLRALPALLACLLLTISSQARIVTVDDDGTGDFDRIQDALDAALDGDTVIVMEGRYTGRGNVNLNFDGKAVTLRSREPNNDDCMRATIIDAEGQGVIVRFINGEGPDSKFEGFTLVAGYSSSLDVSWAQEMADGLRPTSCRADVDGNGLIDAQDIQLISDAVASGTLPAWWNNLTSRQERDEWVTRLMAIDQTDEHPYQTGWFVCLHFAVQTHIHSAFYRGELGKTPYDGGQTVFNVPMYTVSVTAPAFGHSVNGILVGDDPLNFDDWRFLEPQTDYDINPGGWNMPYGSTVRIHNPLTIGSGGSYSSDGDRVKFHVDETGWTMEDYSPNLVLTRPTPTAGLPDNRPDLWNPRILPIGQGMMLFDSCRDDMTLTTDIHLADLPLADPPVCAPLVLSSQYSRLLDVYKGPDGTIHLLWKGKADYVPGVFYGTLDPRDSRLTGFARVSSGKRAVRMGRVITGSEGDVHVFWLEHKVNAIDHYDSGIYWTRRTAEGWQPEENLAPHTDHLLDFSDWDRRELLRYYFDVDLAADGDIILVWAEPIGQTDDSELRQRRFNGTWGASTLIDQTNALGVELARDSGGTFHLAYWRGNRYGGWGSLLHRKSADGYAWSPPVIIDASPNASCPRMAAGVGNVLHIVWERKVGSWVVPVLSKYKDGAWSVGQELEVRSGADAWYPTVDLLDGDSLIVAWSSRSDDRVTIETETIEVIASDFNGDGVVDLTDFAILALAWLTEPGDAKWNPNCDISFPADNLINTLDLTVLVRQWLCGK